MSDQTLPAQNQNGNDVEEWRDIAGWEGIYKVSSHGRILRTAPTGRGGYGCASYIVTGSKNSKGYWQVGLRHKSSRRDSTQWKHKIVASAFLGPRPAGMHINHKDSNKDNNRADNLEYCTPAQNTIHASGVGAYPYRIIGVRDEHRHIIYHLSFRGFGRLTYREIADLFGIKPKQVEFIVRQQAQKLAM